MQKYNVNEKGNLTFGGCDTVELASKYGTPLYVINESYIIERCKEIREDFLEKYPKARAVYASKAFQTLDMCRIVTREGLGLDVVSGGEIYTALKAGVNPAVIVFHGNNKTPDEIELAIKNDVGRLIVDNEHELDLIEEIAAKNQKTAHILFRITPGVDSHTHKFISTGNIDSKFGISPEKEERDRLIIKAMGMKHVKLNGFHFHVGSQLMENTSHLAAVEIILNLVKDVYKDINFVTKELNLGGGFGIQYVEADTRAKVKDFTDPMIDKIKKAFEAIKLDLPELTIEPGRWIVGEAGITLYTIGSVKEVPGVKTYAAVDGGMPDNPRPALYEAVYEAVIANKATLPTERIVTIAGKCCESGDILIHNIEIPNIDSGDILAVFSTGAYNYSMASNYNRIPRPAVVTVKDGESRISVKRETYEDLIQREI